MLQVISLFLADNSGTIATLIVAIIAALVALKIAAMNNRAAIERQTIASVREAYAEWFEAICAYALRLYIPKGVTGNEYDDEVNKFDDARGEIKASTMIITSVAKINVLDPLVDQAVKKIGSSLVHNEWHDELPELSEDRSIKSGSMKEAEAVLKRISNRMLSNTPFSCK